MKKKSPIAKIVFGFVWVIVAGALLLLLPISTKSGQSISFLTALFTATSAVCVTGLAVVDTFSVFSLFGQIVVLVLIQIGGLGFMTMATFIFVLLGKKIGLQERMAIAESFSKEEMSGVVRLAKSVIVVAVSIEVVGAVAISPVFLAMDGGVGLAVWRSIFHSISAFCNAGFDLMGGSGMVPFVANPLFNIITMTLIVLGGIGVGVLLDVAKKVKTKGHLMFNTKIVIFANLFLILFGAVSIFATEFSNPATLGSLNFFEKICASFFQSVTPRTAGFNTFDQSTLTNGGKLLTSLLMFVGASPASTGGGVKVATIVVVIAFIKSIVSTQETVTFGKRELSRKVVGKACVIVFGYVTLILVAVMLLAFSDSANLSLEQMFFECISALSTVGLTLNATMLLSSFGQCIIMCLMFLGRVGFLSLTLLLVSNLNKNVVKFAEAKIVVG